MDVTSVANVATALSQAKLGDAVATAVLKKTNDMAEQHAAQLLQALPPPVTNNPPNLGNKVNTFA